jgi:hypothetical protein
VSIVRQLELFDHMEAVTHTNSNRRERLILPRFLKQAGDEMRLREEQERVHGILIRWADLEKSGRLRRMKERNLQGEFLVDVFGAALGYTMFSAGAAQWHLQPHFAVPGGEADAALGQFGSDETHAPAAFIELKGPTADLDRHRFNGRTPVQQLWDYLNVSPLSPWGIVSNIVSFRLYHRQKTPRAYELFTLQELRDAERFRQFYCLFARGGLIPTLPGQMPRALELLERTDQRQLEVGAELYAKYSEQRVSLINHLMSRSHGKSLDQAIHAAQLLLDRIIFIAFCEDRRLLPPQSIAETWHQVPPFTRVTNPRWRNFLDLFCSVDQGNPRSGVTAFNGGLFREDNDVDNLQLDDDWTTFFKEVGGYDFAEEVGVEVLGHLFEQSVTDLESLRRTANEAKPKRKVVGKRKQEGIYYTPPTVTDFIVKATIGKCIDERFSELEDEYGLPHGQEPTEKNHAKWIRCQEAKLDALRGLRVCDPACGSGAFLIRAYDFLKAAYDDVITALCQIKGVPDFELLEMVKPWILRENLFGVDLSKEAVEITKLALWIRTAEEKKSLAELSENIQQGNSLVDDPAVDPLAFDWRTRLPSVPECKFDCIIGNPPYVKLQNFRKRQPVIAEFLTKRFRSAQTGNFDLYLPFVECGLQLLRQGGRLGFIAPSVWLFNEYGQGLRELVKQHASLERFVDFMSHQVFRDATTYTALQIYSDRPRQTLDVARAPDGNLETLSYFHVGYDKLPVGKNAWALLTPTEQEILDCMRARSTTLGKASSGVIVGIQTSADHIYHLIKLGSGRYWSQATLSEVELEDELLKPLVSGEDAIPFATPPTDKYLLFPYRVADDECRLMTEAELKRYRRCWKYLREHEKELRARERGKFDDDQWWRLGRHQNIDKQHLSKLLVPRLLLHLRTAVDVNGAFCIDNVDVGGILPREGWDQHYLAGILNSRACDYAWRATSKPFRGGYRSANKQFIAPLPIPKTKKQQEISELARRLADLYAKESSAYRSVRRRFAVDLAPDAGDTPPELVKVPGKLGEFDQLTLHSSIRELERFAKRKFALQERERWDAYLTTEGNQLALVKRRIHDALAELNDRVYRLYRLSPEQIRQIEG